MVTTTEVALYLYARVGVTYRVIGWVRAEEVRNEDLLVCPDPGCRCAVLVMGCSLEGETHKLHLVPEGGTWQQRQTEHYPRDMWLYVARSIWAPDVAA